jgi:MerR family transcriptional regulator, light-induced transcriptional regulator
MSDRSQSGGNAATPAARHRSGAVARMLRMPVATLRVWERRYGLTQAALSPSGQRLYSADDVRRLALLKQLSDLGHAIGSLAPLDMAQLHEVAATHAGVLAAGQGERPAPAERPWRVAVVGSALATRLQPAHWQRRFSRPVQWLGPYADAAQAAAALQLEAPDALLLHAPRLQPGWLAELRSAAPGLAQLPTAVLYRFAADPTCEALAAAGIALLREPQNDAVLAQWLQHLLADRPVPRHGAPAAPATPAVAPRRWDDAALADFAGLSSTIACECPRHLAELLIQLGHFEAYSADCEHRSPEDAELHAYLRTEAAAARARFEAALEHVARHEGLTLPP